MQVKAATGFATGRNKMLAISSEALRKARQLFSRVRRLLEVVCAMQRVVPEPLKAIFPLVSRSQDEDPARQAVADGPVTSTSQGCATVSSIRRGVLDVVSVWALHVS